MTAPTFPVPCVNPKPPTMGTWRPAADHECVAPQAADRDHGYMVPAAIIGVDFDNTLIIYDDLLKKLALDRDLLGDRAIEGKRQIRDALRAEPNGEIEWQKLQADAYGPCIGEARLAVGAARFLQLAREAGITVYTISHKTEWASQDRTGTSLRRAALDWMEANGLFADSVGLSPAKVFFGATREEKIAHIRALRCTHFIDDLEETFAETSFPAGVARILYAPHPTPTPPPGVMVVQSWKQICEYFFADNC
jgi:hypothetical protein